MTLYYRYADEGSSMIPEDVQSLNAIIKTLVNITKGKAAVTELTVNALGVSIILQTLGKFNLAIIDVMRRKSETETNPA